MPDAYTYVSKPTTSLYSFTNPQGKEFYDQQDITYDSATTFYDGIDQNQYTTIAKPTSSLYTYVSKPS